MSECRFLAALRGLPVDRTPVWVMRQAGRYLPEYRRVREAAGSFLRLCTDSELAAEVTLQPIRRFGFDAAIVFSDILLPLSRLGVEFAFPEEGGPRLPTPLKTPTAWERLTPTGDDPGASALAETLQRVRADLPGDVALIGFSGAPWTLASYLVEGGTSRDHTATRAALHSSPEDFERLLEVLAEAMAAHLRLQISAGAQAVQVFDSWAGTLSASDYRRHVVPSLSRLLGALDGTVPRVVYVGGGAHLLPVLADLPCEAVSVDWRTPLEQAAALLPGKAVQGNLDPVVLLAGPDATRDATTAMLAAAPERGYVANLGHGILPGTPIASVEAFLATARGRR
jgi:uroporphyrinogen decarboxylase